MSDGEILRINPKDVANLFAEGKMQVVTPGTTTPERSPLIRPEGARVTWNEAIHIMGDDFIGSDKLINTFGGSIDNFGKLKDVLNAPFPYSGAELERHKELGGFVIVRPDRIPGGRGADATMSWGNQRLQDKSNSVNNGKVLYDTDWYKDEDFFRKEVMTARVALVSKDVIPGSTSKNYLQQTEVMVDFLTNVAFRGMNLPAEYQEAIREFLRERPEIESLMGSDWQQAAKRLSQLRLNQMTRQTAAEAMFDTAVYFDNKGQRLLGGKYTWTKSQASDGLLVYVGYFGSNGLNVSSWNPDESSGPLGVVLSR